MAALGVPPLLWLAARRTGTPVAQRARLAGAGDPARLPDAVLLARRAAGAGARAGALVRGRAAAAAGGGAAARRRASRPRRWWRGRSRTTRCRPTTIPLAAARGRRPRARRAAPADGRRAAGGRAGGRPSSPPQRPPAPRTRRIAGRVLLGALAVRAGRAPDRGRHLAGRLNGQASDAWHTVDRIPRRRRRPTRRTA